MPLDPNNPALPPAPPPAESDSLIQWRIKNAEAALRQAAAAEAVAASSSETPSTEGAIFLRMLSSVLVGKLATSSDDAIIWAKDLTKEYLLRYELNGTPKAPVSGQGNGQGN